jgi:Coenzyme PQQ synthesis protein D (PqqD)
VRAPTPAVRYGRRQTALSECFQGATVVVDCTTGAVARLNAAAGCVWEALIAPRTLAQAAAVLESRFGIPVVEALRDASAALAQLEAAGLVLRIPG